jgi:hypothetical protein
MNLFYSLIELDENDDLHLSRLLVLLRAFSGRSKNKKIEGLTKLAKLDFLLRYPVYLERYIQKWIETSRPDIKIKDFERKSIESSMIRFRYGPWDFRYRRFINILVAKGLVCVECDGKTIQIGLTELGLEISDEISKMEAFQDFSERAAILKKHFDWKARTLMERVYETFPEISSLRYGDQIK